MYKINHEQLPKLTKYNLPLLVALGKTYVKNFMIEMVFYAKNIPMLDIT